MSSPFLPNTLAIAQGIVALAQTVTFSLTSGATTFNTVKLGGVKDLTDILPAMTVELLRDGSKRGGSGGNQVGWRLEEAMQFRIAMYTDYTNAQNAEQDIILMRDATIALFQQCIKLGNTVIGGTLPAVPNVMDSQVLPDSGVGFWREITGTTYRGYMFVLKVTQQYSVTVAVG